MPKMNDMEKRYHHKLMEQYDPEDIKCQKRISFMDEVKVFWNMDFVMKDKVVDVKGRLQRETKLKTKLWEVLGDRPLEVVRVTPHTGRCFVLKTVKPDPQKIRDLIFRLQKNLAKIESGG